MIFSKCRRFFFLSFLGDEFFKQKLNIVKIEFLQLFVPPDGFFFFNKLECLSMIVFNSNEHFRC